MAERRMFAKTIVLSDAFLDMPSSARCLYFTLGMFADDDGFVNNPKSIMRQSGSCIDDINILLAKKFLIQFEDGVIVIKHWKIHNYIQKDRYVPTKYVDEKNQLYLDENNAYTLNESSAVKYVCESSTPKLTGARAKRYEAKKESDLPYSFDYKIRTAFVGKRCPICGCIMDNSNNLTKPTIQHNIPISKGGKHEIGNISVICQSCNTSIQNRETTGDLNNSLVREKWEEICNVSGMDTQDSIGKVSIGKVSIDAANYKDKNNEIRRVRERLERYANKDLIQQIYGSTDLIDEVINALADGYENGNDEGRQLIEQKAFEKDIQQRLALVVGRLASKMDIVDRKKYIIAVFLQAATEE